MMMVVIMIIMRTIKTKGIISRIYKIPATWTSYFADIITNPHNNFAMQALLALFSHQKYKRIEFI